jgi:hypothetical protein
MISGLGWYGIRMRRTRIAFTTTNLRICLLLFIGGRARLRTSMEGFFRICLRLLIGGRARLRTSMEGFFHESRGRDCSECREFGFCARKTTESSNLEAKLNQGLTAAPSVLYFAIARFASHINRLLWCRQRTFIVLSYSLSLMIPCELHFRLDFRVYHRNKVEFCCWPLALVRGCLVYHINLLIISPLHPSLESVYRLC